MVPIDIGVSQINTPISSCNLSSMEPIEVKVFNFGTDTIFNFTITCDTDNVTQTFSERVNLHVAPLDPMNYSFFATTQLAFNTNLFSRP
jgi:hypothetical protein